MNTRFELVLHGDNDPALRAAGEEALREIARIEALLSAFRPTSEIAVLNARAAKEPVQVSPEVFALLQEVHALHTMTGGAFDVTIGPLMKCWGLWGTTEGRLPTDAELGEARDRVGWPHVVLDEAERTVRLGRAGMTLDLGGIGKGYALDRAAELLRDHGVTSAFLHGGTSSVIAIGHPPGQSAWRTELHNPQRASGVSPEDLSFHPGENGSADETSAARWLGDRGVTQPTLELLDEALSVSSISTKAFVSGDRTLGHVLDPRTGEPVRGATLSAVILPDAARADALSTALLVLGPEGLGPLRKALPRLRGLVISGNPEAPEMNAVGLEGV